jgi:hypothetical protein
MVFEKFGPYGRLWICIGAVLLASFGAARAQTSESVLDPGKIVRDASWNELHPPTHGHPFRYRLYKEDAKGSTVKEIVETKDGDVARLVQRNGRPLTAEENQAELNRLNNLLAHPEIQQHRHKKEQEDSARGDEMVRMLPDAFLYTYDGIVQGPNGPCYRFKFKPNPAFVPPDREGEVYHGMVGELWVDKEKQRLTKIDAHLVSDVNFGWGVIGKLYKGGSILVENANVGMDHWEAVLLQLKLQGKILLVKNEDFSTTERSTNFRPVPPESTYQDAIRMLEKEDIVQNGG